MLKYQNITTIYQHFVAADYQLITDSRKITEGCIYLALKGENFDGNAFAQAALEAGASYAVVDDPTVVKGTQYLYVENGLSTLQELARHHRQQFHIPIIGITGSNGKTTTKELMSTVLSGRYRTHWTKGNFNNHIGVPLTLLAMPLDTEVAIIEMGANKPLDIKELVEIALPTHGLVTNVGKAHLEGFGGLEGVVKTKKELYDFLAQNKGTAFYNADESHLASMSEQCQKRIAYGQSIDLYGDLSAQKVEGDTFVNLTFTYRKEQLDIKSQLYGDYNFNNMMTAVVIGKYFKVSGEAIKQAIESYTSTNNRSQITEIESNTFLLDAYNANPTSMRNAIDSLTKWNIQSQRIAVLGEMLEMGAESAVEHKELVDYVLSKPNIDFLLVFGEAYSQLRVKDARYFHTIDRTALIEHLKTTLQENTAILIKGSRGSKMELVVEAFKL